MFPMIWYAARFPFQGALGCLSISMCQASPLCMTEYDDPVAQMLWGHENDTCGQNSWNAILTDLDYTVVGFNCSGRHHYMGKLVKTGLIIHATCTRGLLPAVCQGSRTIQACRRVRCVRGHCSFIYNDIVLPSCFCRQAMKYDNLMQKTFSQNCWILSRLGVEYEGCMASDVVELGVWWPKSQAERYRTSRSLSSRVIGVV